jgi:hypothetical protein
MDVPIASLKEAIKEVNPNFLLMFNINPNQSEKLQVWLDEFTADGYIKKFYVCCSLDDKEKVTAHDGQQLITSYEDFLEVVNK